MKIFILTFLKHLKSFNNLIFNLSIKSVASFSYIKLVMKYYSYFKFILEYFKGNRFYTIFKAFFKVIALINILLGIFTLIVFTDFRFNYEDYKKFIEYNITNFSFNNLIFNFKNYIKRILKKVASIFGDDSITIDTPNSDKLPNTYNLGKESIKSDSYTPYYFLLAFVTIVVCFQYPEYTVTPIISGITSFVWSFIGGEDDEPGNDDKDGSSNTLDKGKGRAITKLDIDHLTPSSNPDPSTKSAVPSSTTSTKSIFKKYLPFFEDKTVSSIGIDLNDMLTGNPFADSGSDTSSSSSSTVTQSNIASSSSSASHSHTIYLDPFDSDLDHYLPEQSSATTSSSSSTVTQSSVPSTSSTSSPTTPTTPSGSKLPSKKKVWK